VIYTDEFKIQDNVSARIAYVCERNSDEKSWNLENSLEVFDVELFAIFQALKWTQLKKSEFFLTVKLQFKDFRTSNQNLNSI